jgi:branched-chain amino acid transport system substrate-binding protein
LQEIAGQVGIPLIIHTSSHDDLSGRLCNRWSYRVSIPYGVQYHAISPYLTGYGKKWFILGVDGTSGPAMVKVARAGMIEAGAQEIGSEVASQELKDFGPVIQRIVAAKPDVVVGALQGTSLTAFLRAWLTAKVGTQIPYAQIGLTDADLWNAGAEAARETGGVYTKTWDFASTRLTDDDKAFVAAFAKRMNGQMPETRAWQAYMAMHALLTAIDKAGSTDADKIRLGLDAFRDGGGDLPLAFRAFDHQMLHRVPVFETKSTITDPYHWLDSETFIPEKVADIGPLYGTAETAQCKGIAT